MCDCVFENILWLVAFGVMLLLLTHAQDLQLERPQLSDGGCQLRFGGSWYPGVFFPATRDTKICFWFVAERALHPLGTMEIRHLRSVSAPTLHTLAKRLGCFTAENLLGDQIRS